MSMFTREDAGAISRVSASVVPVVLPETIVFAVVGLLDMLTTVQLLRGRVAIEANPLLAMALTRGGIAGFVFVKVLFIVLPLAGIEIFRRRRPDFARVAMRVGIVGYLLVYVLFTLRQTIAA